ncbi:MAG TPA: thiamine pyrophosphate-binding protein [Burkholderiales bacterium]|nr:thiamine pyrophosphate-binding protein [Burkholderiales bacterium]
MRGADILARTLSRAGAKHVFSLSGNHVMSVYDAALDAELDILHVRHEAAAVHMADAWGRLTGEPGVALLTGGPGHANGVSALYTALASESPLVLLSGEAPIGERHKGAFQEMRQGEMAAPVVKAAFCAQSARTIGEDLARAWRQAKFGRPGPVYLGLPSDVLEAKIEPGEGAVPAAEAFAVKAIPLGEAAAQAVLAELARARRPLVLAGPAMSSDRGRAALRALADAAGVPALCMESPRGVNDPSLGALAKMLAQADLVVLLGKRLDFTLRYGQPPTLAAGCRIVLLDPEPEALRQAGYALGDPARLALAALANPLEAAAELARLAQPSRSGWTDEVAAALRARPAARQAAGAGAVHPAELGRAVQREIERAGEAVLVADGGEFGQWAQACVSAPTRLINGPAGAIGSALPFAIAAKLARPAASVFAMLGDGTFGFHMAEFDTALRAKLPFVAVVGNDGCWNAEHQIQLRAYGPERARGCELLPTRYDRVAAALGGHGEHVERAAELPAALQRAAGSGRAACVNVMIERLAAPVLPA